MPTWVSSYSARLLPEGVHPLSSALGGPAQPQVLQAGGPASRQRHTHQGHHPQSNKGLVVVGVGVCIFAIMVRCGLVCPWLWHPAFIILGKGCLYGFFFEWPPHSGRNAVRRRPPSSAPSSTKPPSASTISLASDSFGTRLVEWGMSQMELRKAGGGWWPWGGHGAGIGRFSRTAKRLLSGLKASRINGIFMACKRGFL